MKKSFCSLGNKIDVISNRKDYSRKFTMDLDYEGEELISVSYTHLLGLEYDDNTPSISNFDLRVFDFIGAPLSE